MNELDLFAAAIEIADPAERAAFLDRECAGRSDLRQRLDQLLDAHARSHSVLDAAAEAAPEPTAAFAADQPGAVIAGRYKLLELIGEGGMGAVWVAEQTEPVRRKVALKLIKAGMDSRSVLARFEAERQALALMDHPNIAKVLDGGLTDRGRPFFVMEYVKGVPITDYCDAARLSVTDRLSLFVQVCHAVQHAHQKGIIHRDLKPSNILVAPYDDKPVPKVIDFGLAKAMHQSLTDKTIHTAHESVLGTPLYMSPEQAQLNNLDVDTRSDVYSLGVLLYELLTGTTPVERKRLKQAAWDEVRRIIREEEPPRPSARLSSTDTLPSVAAGRQIEPVRLTKLVRGELDWIVMKALEKDRIRRYETANGFAMDVQRYLGGESVLAVPPSAAYRMRKFLRRNRGPVLAASVAALLLTAGAIGTTLGLLRAVAAERKAVAQAAQIAEERDRAVRAEAEASDQRRAAVEQKARAAEKAEIADAVSNFLRADILAATPFQSIGQGNRAPAVTIIDAVDRAAARVGNRFVGRPLVEANVRATLGNTYLELHLHEKAGEQLEQALQLFRAAKGETDDAESLRALLTLAWLRLTDGRLDESERLHAELVQRAERSLPKGHGLLRTARGHYACCLAGRRKFDLAEPLFQAVIDEHLRTGGSTPGLQMVRNNLAQMYRSQGRVDDAEQLFRLALKEHRRLTSDVHPNTVLLLKNLASNCMEQDRFAEAIPLLEEAVMGERKAFGESRPKDLIDTLLRLSLAYGALDRWRDAGRVARQVLAIDPQGTLISAAARGNCLAVAAMDHLGRNEFREAETVARECLTIRQRVGPDEWGTSNARSLLGGALLGQGKYSEAEPLLLSGYEGLVKQESKVAALARLSEAVDRLVNLYTAWGKPDEAAKWRAEREKHHRKPASPEKNAAQPAKK